MRTPSHLAGTRTRAHAEPQPARQLIRLADDLWIDPDAIESVKTYTDRTRYHRMVNVITRSGQKYVVTAVRSNPYGASTDHDRLLHEYLVAHFGDLLDQDGERDG